MLINPAKYVYKTTSSKGYLTSVKVAVEKANYEDKISSFLVRSVQDYIVDSKWTLIFPQVLRSE